MSEPSDQLISAYLDGEVSAEERAAVERLLAQSEPARRLLDELRSLQSDLHALPQEKLGPDFAASVLRQAERAMLMQPRDSVQGGKEPQAADTPADLPEDLVVPPVSISKSSSTSPPSTVGSPVRSRWKPLIAAVAVLAAAVMLMVAGPRRWQVSDEIRPVADSSAASGLSRDALRRSEETANVPVEESLSDSADEDAANGAPAKSWDVKELKKQFRPAAPAIPPAEKNARGNGYADRAEDARDRKTDQKSKSQDRRKVLSEAEEKAAAGGPPPAANAIVLGAMAPELPTPSEGGGPPLYVYVKVTQSSWSSGEFQALLRNNRIQWQPSATGGEADMLDLARVDRSNDKLKEQVQAVGDGEPHGELPPPVTGVVVQASQQQLQGVLQQLQLQAQTGRGVLAVALAPASVQDKALPEGADAAIQNRQAVSTAAPAAKANAKSLTARSLGQRGEGKGAPRGKDKGKGQNRAKPEQDRNQDADQPADGRQEEARKNEPSKDKTVTRPALAREVQVVQSAGKKREALAAKPRAAGQKPQDAPQNFGGRGGAAFGLAVLAQQEQGDEQRATPATAIFVITVIPDDAGKTAPAQDDDPVAAPPAR